MRCMYGPEPEHDQGRPSRRVVAVADAESVGDNHKASKVVERAINY
jgi:hypothetical protein